MIKRDPRTISEINSHMFKLKCALHNALPFATDEYACLVCNAYFRKKIYESDLEVIIDLIKIFNISGNAVNESALVNILETSNNLKTGIENLYLNDDFHQVMPDDLKFKLRNLHKTKPTKDSRVHDIEGEAYDDFYAKYSRDLDHDYLRSVQSFSRFRLIKPSRILDIGCGFGLLSLIAEFNGHKVDSIDIPNASPILKEATKLLKITKHEFTVKKNTPLLKFKHKFDCVNATQIFFNGHASKNLWDVSEWKYFLMDVHDNLLNDNGKIFLVFNGEHIKLKPIIIDGEPIFLGKKSLGQFFKPFFIDYVNMPKTENKMIVVMTKKNIKEACQYEIFKKQTYSIDPVVSKYGA